LRRDFHDGRRDAFDYIGKAGPFELPPGDGLRVALERDGGTGVLRAIDTGEQSGEREGAGSPSCAAPVEKRSDGIHKRAEKMPEGSVQEMSRALQNCKIAVRTRGAGR